MKRIALLCTAAFAAFTASAQISITSGTMTYTQDFNTLDTGGATNTNMPAGWSFYEWSGTSVNATYRGNNGSLNTGDTYSYGATQNTERALGSLCSGGVGKVNYGVRFTNNTGSGIDSMTLSFREEQWRRGGGTTNDTVSFYFSTASGATISDTTFTNWTRVPALMMNSISTSATGAAMNGNDTFRILTAKFRINLAAGGTVALRWYDFNSVGSDDGLAIDSVTAMFKNGTVGGVGVGKVAQAATLPVSIINPATNGSFAISCTLAQASALNAHVYDLNGREVAAQTFNATKGDNRLQLHTSLAAGTYIIRVDDGKEWGSVKATMQ